MSEDKEEVVTKIDIRSINPEAIAELLQFRNDAIDAIVCFYAKNFDKVFGKLTEKLKESEEKSKKYEEIRERHLKEYRIYIENRVERLMKQLFTDKAVATKLVFISENFDRFPPDLVNIHSAVDPFRQQFIEQLKAFEQTLDLRLKSKTKTLEELTENLIKSQESYESLRKSVQKRVLTIIKDLETIEIQDLNPKTD